MANLADLNASQDAWADHDADSEMRRASSGLSLKQLLHILLKHKLLIVACFAGSLAMAKTIGLFIVPAYVATSQILLSPGPEHVADFSLPTGGAIPPWVRFNAEEEIGRTVELLSGRFLAERVVRTIGADVLYPERAHPRWNLPSWIWTTEATDPEAREEAAILRFMGAVAAEAANRAPIINVSFKHEDPELSARAVNLLLDLYLERYLGIQENPKADVFFQAQFENLKRKLRASESQLLAFKQRHGITSSVNDEQVLLRQMQTGLRGDLNEVRSRQAELQSREGELRRQISEHGTLYGNLQADLSRNGTEMKALNAREASVASKIADLQGRMDALERVRDEYSHLEKQVKADEDNYRLYLHKFEEVRIAGAMDKERIVSVRVIEPARPPSRPMESRAERLLALGGLLGLAGGVALALLLQLWRGTLDTAEDVEKALHLPVLASICD
jgi:uncharacterized protein involved in exopolysaccharide biosynthesis